VIYLYAIADGRAPRLDGQAGFGGRPLRALEYGGLAAVYSDEPPVDLAPTEDALWHHEHVVERLMADRAVLPLRFASRLAGEAELRELLAERGDEFAAALATVRGCVEMGVRASAEPDPAPAADPPAPPGSGRAYVADKLERRRAAAGLGEAVHRELAPLARASTFGLATEPRPAFAGAYLVDRAAVAGFRRRCERTRAARPGLDLACSGPWPPYSFAEPAEGA
jgi:Gas vesicle synthesis protein GvpL/GvpF